MEVRLVLVAPPQHKQVLSVSLPAVVGRGADATLRIPQDSVSRRHCEIFATEDAVCIRDLGSTNGTRIGSKKIAANAAIAVESGSVVQVGDARFQIEYATVTTRHEEQAATHHEEPAEVIIEEPAPVPGAAAMPALPAAVPTMTETVKQPPTGFEFAAPDELPATNDASLDEFLKGFR